MFDFIKKIKKLFSGGDASKCKKASNSNQGRKSKSPDRPNIPPSRDHEFKRSRPGSQEPRQSRRQERDQQRQNQKKTSPQNQQQPKQEKRRENDQARRQRSERQPRRDGFSENRERRERYANRKGSNEAESPLKDAEVKIAPELVLTDWNPADFVVEPEEGKKRFHDFDLPEPIMHAVYDLGFKYCTPIQAASLEKSLAGANVAGRAQTGTGKTAAYLLTILTRYLNGQATPVAQQAADNPAAASAEAPAAGEGAVAAESAPATDAAPAENEPGQPAANPAAKPTEAERPRGAPRALVIAPTRELCVQIANDARALGKYCGLRSMAVFGGMDYARQARELQDAPLDLLAATPGRLLDFQRQHIVDLSKIDTLVIDEADRMLDMGFIPDVRRIIRCLPAKRQTLLYSATLDDNVMRLASQWMPDPVKVEIEPEKTANQSIEQKVFIVTSSQKFTILCHLLDQFAGQRILVFGNRRASTDHLADQLRRQGYECELLSGDVSQTHRMKVLDAFRDGSVKLVVATDVAGRGLHIADIGLVVNFELPYEAEDYVHRIGRTGRAGKVGTAVSFADEDESFIIPDIEKYIGEDLKCSTPEEDLLAPLPPPRRRNPRRNPRRSEGDAAPAGEAAATAEQPAEVQAPSGKDPAQAEVGAEVKSELPAPMPVPIPERVSAPAPDPKSVSAAEKLPPLQNTVVVKHGSMKSQVWSPGQK